MFDLRFKLDNKELPRVYSDLRVIIEDALINKMLFSFV